MDFHVFAIIRHSGERVDPSPGSPRSPSRSSSPFLSLASHSVAVWEGRGATVRPREAEWGSGVAAVFWVYYYKNIIKDPFGHHYHYRGALHDKYYY